MSKIYGTGQFNPKRFERSPRSGGRRLYLWGLGLFLFAISLSIGFGFYLFTRTPNSFTGEQVAISITPPNEVTVGGDVTYTITINNNEDRDLDNVELYIQFPESSARPTATFVKSNPAPTSDVNNTWRLGTIHKGSMGVLELTMRLTGDEQAQITLPIQATFSPRDFKSEFSVSHDATITLGKPLVDVVIQGPVSAASGSEVALQIQLNGLSALSESQLRDLALTLQIPKGLSVISYDPSPIAENSAAWQLADLRSEEGSYELLVRLTVGSDAGAALLLGAVIQHINGTALAQKTHTIVLQSSRAAVAMEATPAQGQKLQWGESVRYTVVVTNASAFAMRDTVVSVQLSGEQLWDSDSLTVEKGGFAEGSGIFWDAKTTSALDSIRPGTSVTLAFTAVVQKTPPPSFTGTPALLAKAQVHASLDDATIAIESPEIVTKVLATVALDATGWYTSPEGIQWGSGSHPPLAGSETTYAIVWSLGPSSGELTDLTMAAVLPDGVLWKNETDLTIGEISYTESTKTVIWKASRVPKLALPFAVRFMVGITPARQTGNATPLMGRSNFSATDAASGEKMELYSTALTVGNVN